MDGQVCRFVSYTHKERPDKFWLKSGKGRWPLIGAGKQSSGEHLTRLDGSSSEAQSWSPAESWQATGETLTNFSFTAKTQAENQWECSASVLSPLPTNASPSPGEKKARETSDECGSHVTQGACFKAFSPLHKNLQKTKNLRNVRNISKYKKKISTEGHSATVNMTKLLNIFIWHRLNMAEDVRR